MPYIEDSSEKQITAIVAEDHELTRMGLKMILRTVPGLRVIDEVGDGETAVHKAKELQPDLVLMDVGLPRLDGIAATKMIKEQSETKVIMLTANETDESVCAGLGAGADGYCLKGISGNRLGNAIRSVMSGGVWIDSGITKHVIDAMNNGRTSSAGSTKVSANTAVPPCNLSERETQILNLLIDGLSNQEMADRLYVSIETVKAHMRHIMEKLNAADRTQVAVKALKLGLVDGIN